MFNFGYTFIFTAINMFVLWFILKKIFFKPVTEFMQKRTESIQKDIDDAKKDKNEAEKLRLKYEEILKGAREEAAKIISDAENTANLEYQRIINEAKEQAQAIIDKAHVAIEEERAEMVKDIKNQVASLALAAASKVIEANMDTENNRALVDKFIKEEGAA